MASGAQCNKCKGKGEIGTGEHEEGFWYNPGSEGMVYTDGNEIMRKCYRCNGIGYVNK